ncbi:uncharacterized protein LY89DRAFT_788039 [Mollisia scopiformis]|uniref:Helicase ATP-binding domain-containing protein n=1 Tax=Mollisia scopiformis TaxID=149040 RepID=A0A132BBJ4_MOLSC|nr:uncharacterized protein LY89DRAFT_788039 [Mollisia scopiformis]KUJ09785.1 hypothetical protein LY89DRAFT_788039 [Mollisia scopiformis]
MDGKKLDSIELMTSNLVLGKDGNLRPELKKAADTVGALKIATMCSGSDAPIFFIELLCEDLIQNHDVSLSFDHVFSAEIVPFKQAFIQRNFHPKLIFKDIAEFFRKELKVDRKATTAYGSRIEVPSDVDILFAGFSCKDFSRLNKSPKTLEDAGESAVTFAGLIAYMKNTECRPKLVVMENVLLAPWKKIREYVEANTQYLCTHTHLDTKKYYLPQTRNRRYMICALRTSDLESDDACRGKLKDWTNSLKEISNNSPNPAASFEEMLQSAHNTKYEDSKQGNWASSKYLAAAWRETLGTERPFTNWSLSGKKRLPDYFRPSRGITERTLDLLDCVFLEQVRYGIDIRYYSRFIECSQNVARNPTSHDIGLLSCLKTDVIPIWSIEGRRLSGWELMLFQGFPINRIDFTSFSDKEICDLNGNAMSTTVVGAATIAALEIFHMDLTQRGPTASLPSVATSPSEHHSGENNNLSPMSNSVYTTCSTSELIARAIVSVQICSCEGWKSGATSFKECAVCKHTACTNCGKNPVHEYTAKQSTPAEATTKAQFVRYVKAMLPAILRLNPAECTKPPLDDVEISYREHYQNALECTFHMSSVQRSEVWEIIYEGACARLVLVISRGGRAQWFLYATPTTLDRSDVRKYLDEFPIMRMDLDNSGANITHGSWYMWLPEPEKLFSVRITGCGSAVPSFHAACGIPEHKDDEVYVELEINVLEQHKQYVGSDLSGTYKYRPRCGQAFDSLHIKEGATAEPVYLFLQHPIQGSEIKHTRFVFARNCRKLGYSDHRMILGSLPPNFRQPLVSSLDPSETTSLKVYGCWKDCDDISIKFDSRGVFQEVNFSCQDLASISDSNSLCKKWHEGFQAENIQLDALDPQWSSPDWTIVKHTLLPDFFRKFFWAIWGGLHTQHWPKDSKWKKAGAEENGCPVACNDCCPKPPSAHWGLQASRNEISEASATPLADALGTVEQPDDEGHAEKDPPVKVHFTLVPFEIPEEAFRYEQNLPSTKDLPLKLRYKTSEKDRLMTIQLLINLAILIHRAIAELTRRGGKPIVSSEWRLVTNDDLESVSKRAPFALQRSTNINPAPEPEGLKLKLDEAQLRSLAWHLNQENSPPHFDEEEVFEARIPEIGCRLEARATRKLTARGGLMLHEVGFGKTIIALCLILQQAASKTHANWSKEPGSSIRLDASIIFVPTQLTLQWREEIHQHMPDTYKAADKVIMIRSSEEMRALSVQKFKEAEIIIADVSMLTAEAYTDDLAALAGMDELHSGASRGAKVEWYEAARKAISSNSTLFESKPKEFWDEVDKSLEKHREEVQWSEMPSPMHRYKKDEVTVEHSGALLKTNDIPVPISNQQFSSQANERQAMVFELFEFCRVFFDEYHYLEDPILVMMQNVKAQCRWPMSATPQLETQGGVAKAASLLGINLGRLDYTSMSQQTFAKSTREATNYELLAAYHEPYSVAWRNNVHRREEDFLKKLACQDIVDVTAFTVSESWRIVYPSTAHRLGYYEMQQLFAFTNFDLKRRPGQNKHTSRAIYYFSAVYKPRDVNGRLVKDNSHSQPNSRNDTLDCDKIIAQRGHERNIAQQTLKSLLEKLAYLEYEPKDVSNGKDCKRFSDYKSTIKGSQNLSAASKFILGAIKGLTDLDADTVKNLQLSWSTYGIVAPKNKLAKHQCVWYHWAVKELIVGTAALQNQDAALHEVFNDLHRYESAKTLHEKNRICCQNCDSRTDSSKMVVLGSYGHLLCQRSSCLPPESEDEGSCPLITCQLDYASVDILRASELKVKERHVDGQFSTYGNKIHAVVSLIQEITTDSEDCVLLFVQGHRVLTKTVEALNKAKLKPAKLDYAASDAEGAETIAKFQQADSKIKVLVLDIGSQEAAGSNLQRANHVIFLQPYFTSGISAQNEYEATMKQAIGRCVRRNQEKEVHVYHYMTANTIDVDIIEKRKDKKVVAMVEKNEAGDDDDKDQNDVKQGVQSKPTDDEFFVDCELVSRAEDEDEKSLFSSKIAELTIELDDDWGWS